MVDRAVSGDRIGACRGLGVQERARMGYFYSASAAGRCLFRSFNPAYVRQNTRKLPCLP
jgi:hypothetical protein